MTKKITLLLYLLICLSIETFAQVKVYYNKDNSKTAVLDSADYYTLCADSSCKEGLIQEFYVSKDQIKIKKALKEGKLEGELTEYYRNGNLKRKEIYQQGKVEGISTSYHQNGNKASTKIVQYKAKETIEKFIDAWDITGLQTLHDGYGRVFEYFDNGNIAIDRLYRKHLLHEVSTMYFNNGKIFCMDIYHKGKFIKGKSWDKEGNHYTYKDVRDQQPLYRGGMPALAKFLSDNLKYPKEATKKNIEGTVYVQFLVNKQGKVEKVKVLKGLPILSKEAVRVVGLMPDWEAGFQAGQKVNVLYNLPIKFKLTK